LRPTIPAWRNADAPKTAATLFDCVSQQCRRFRLIRAGTLRDAPVSAQNRNLLDRSGCYSQQSFNLQGML
jgi:hypothetical protein